MGVKRTQGKLPERVIVNQIDIRTINRKTQDIENWRHAIRAFENRDNPNRVSLYDLYDDIMLDGQIESTWGKRRDAILNKNIVCTKEGKQHEELNKLLNSSNMRDLVEDLLDTIIWGYTLLQINGIEWNEDEEQYVIDYDLVPRKHVHPERGFECVSRQQTLVTPDFLFKEPPLSEYMIWAGKPKSFGLMAKSAQYVIYKRGGFGDWAQFAEMFGMPFREGIYPDYDEESRIKLTQAMEQYGGSMYMVHQQGTEFKIHETQGAAGSNTVYKDIVAACDAAISKIILGNTLTTEQGATGARSLGEVHMEIEQSKYLSDQRFILSVLNTQFRAVLKRFGFDISGWEIWFETPPSDWEQLQKKYNVIAGIADRIPVDDDYFYEEFDIPKPENYETLKEDMRAAQSFNPLMALSNPIEQTQENPEKKKRGQAQNLLGRLRNYFA